MATEKARYSEATPNGIDSRPIMGDHAPRTAEEGALRENLLTAQKLLTEAGYRFEVDPSGVEEPEPGSVSAGRAPAAPGAGPH